MSNVFVNQSSLDKFPTLYHFTLNVCTVFHNIEKVNYLCWHINRRQMVRTLSLTRLYQDHGCRNGRLYIWISTQRDTRGTRRCRLEHRCLISSRKMSMI